jgi:hypothetical protein
VLHYFFYIALFGLFVVTFLWLRDCRIYLRTGLFGYRKGAMYGIGCTALSIFGAGFIFLHPQLNLIGLACVLIGLYIQGKVEREKVFTNQPSWERFTGKTPQNHASLTERNKNQMQKKQKGT